MQKSKKLMAVGALTIGIGAGAYLASPQGMSASSNVILASVDWVTSQINPINSKITSLEAKINAQQTEINNLKAQLGQGGSPSTPPTTPPPAGEIPSVVYVNKNSVTIHSGATREYKVLSTKSMGNSLKVIDSFTASTGLWYRVEVTSSVKGWVFSGDVSTTKTSAPTQVITTGDVHLRKGATTGYTILVTIPKGTSLKYYSTFVNSLGETWYNVETSTGDRGWIYGGLGEVR
jgi:uncharacterized protein YgiM (DUF1202 family)